MRQQHIRILYSRIRSPFSLAVRAASWWGPWSHCAVIDGVIVIEALGRRGRVVETPLHEAIERASACEIVEVGCWDPDAALAFARSTVGKPYDWSGLFGFALRERDWQRPDRWYCSEHVEATLAAGGRHRWRPGMHGVSPNQSYFAA